MKGLSALFCFILSTISFAQTSLVSLDPEMAKEAQDVIMQDEIPVGMQRQEQEERLFDKNLTYEEEQAVYDDEVVNGYVPRDHDDEGIIY